MPWSQLKWEVTGVSEKTMFSRLDWSTKELLAIFPFPHHVEMAVRIEQGDLILQTRVIAGRESPVPISFGFHPYFGLPEIPRAHWKLKLPPMRRLLLDSRGIPKGEEEPFAAIDAPLGMTRFDDGFALPTDRATFSLSGAEYTINIEFLNGFRYLQVFAPNDKELIAIEPMTAPTSALTSGQGLHILPPGKHYVASLRISVDRQSTNL